PIEYWIWFGGLALAGIVLFLIGRIALRLLQEAQAGNGPKEDQTATRPRRAEVAMHDFATYGDS
ncbi:MAG: hypothetical protein ACXV8A_01905, partial [Chthoniobacterales bacterium]